MLCYGLRLIIALRDFQDLFNGFSSYTFDVYSRSIELTNYIIMITDQFPFENITVEN